MIWRGRCWSSSTPCRAPLAGDLSHHQVKPIISPVQDKGPSQGSQPVSTSVTVTLPDKLRVKCQLWSSDYPGSRLCPKGHQRAPSTPRLRCPTHPLTAAPCPTHPLAAAPCPTTCCPAPLGLRGTAGRHHHHHLGEEFGFAQHSCVSTACRTPRYSLFAAHRRSAGSTSPCAGRTPSSRRAPLLLRE